MSASPAVVISIHTAAFDRYSLRSYCRTTIVDFAHNIAELVFADENHANKHGLLTQFECLCHVHFVRTRGHTYKAVSYRAANTIFGKIGRNAAEKVTLHLLTTKCVPTVFIII